MKIDIQELKKRDEYINCQKHNDLDLLIWNYNNHCQFDRAWDNYTIQTRGLVTDLNGEIVARPFNKFFNFNETEETKVENLPSISPQITEKLDGSLGIQYYNGDKVCITTRGSFNSDQAIWATAWIQKRFTKKDFKEGFTYLYEIIYPENRVVVNYGDKKELILLAVKNIETGEEIDFVEEAKRLKLSYAKIINKSIHFLSEYVSKMSSDEEGFVLKYKNLRVKIKGEEYLRLHRLITGFSTKSIWECLKNKQDLTEILEAVPDEFYDWVKEKEKELNERFEKLMLLSKIGYEEVKDLPTRKLQALEIIKTYKEVSGLIFGLLDKKNTDERIWKMIKPEYELPFKTEIK